MAFSNIIEHAPWPFPLMFRRSSAVRELQMPRMLTKSTDALMPPVTVELADYEVVISRLKTQEASLDCEILKQMSEPRNGVVSGTLFVLLTLRYLCAGEQKILSSINNDLASAKVPWIKEARCISPPSWMADIKTYITRFSPQGVEGTILSSLVGWHLCILLEKECVHGKKQSNRTVKFEVVLASAFVLRGHDLCLALRVGIRSDDKDFLSHHFTEIDEPSGADNIRVAALLEQSVSFADNAVHIAEMRSCAAKEFSLAEFFRRMIKDVTL